MQFARLFLSLVLLAALGACAPSKFRTYTGPEVTRVVVYKAERRMDLLHYGTVLKSYRVQLGGQPFGHKEREGDRRTPEGDYIIDRRNPNSAFHLSIGIDYPNEADRAHATANGWRPGGDIFIHGRGPRFQRARGDWTDGCISVTDRQMEDIYAMVRNGTPITIFASKQQELERDAPAALPVVPLVTDRVTVLPPVAEGLRPMPSPVRVGP